MNKLSYKIEEVELDDGYEKFKTEGFFYVVDGKKIEYKNYFPIDHYEILTNESDDPFEDKNMVILNCCTCGTWACDCMVATVIEKPASVQWKIHRLRDEEITETYEFDKAEYEQVMLEIQKYALKKMGKGSFYHWKDRSTYAIPDTKKEDILRYWEQQMEQKTPLAYFEDIETGKLFTVSENKEIIPYNMDTKN